MPENIVRLDGTQQNYKDDRGGGSTYTSSVIGVVKNNIDETHSGRIQVYISKFGGSDPNDSKNWTTVNYLSPFYGVSGLDSAASTTDGYGKYVGNPQSYGFWGSAPDIGTEVVCTFIEGKLQYGFYIGCVPKTGLLSMTPALGSAESVVPNGSESKAYGGATRLPVTEINNNNPNMANSGTVVTDPKPVHSYQAAILQAQGLLRDNDRGVISSSAQRESPSRVFGISSPGGPIYAGGYTNSTILKAADSADATKLQVIGRTGGHTFVMDDGTFNGKDNLMRMRTSGGHMIMMNDTAQTLFIIHSNGQSWVELGKEGTIDMYSTNSVNIRTQGDLNFHADRNVNIHAKKDLNLYGENVNVEADINLSQRAGADYAQYAVGNYTVKSSADLSLLAGGTGSLAAGDTYINGGKVYLNTGSASTTPAEVPIMPKTNHIDTINSTSKGWMYPSPNALLSITSRAPAHQPWIGSGKGVDVKIESSASSSTPVTTSKVDAINASTSNVPNKPTTPSVTKSVPSLKSSANGLLKGTDVQAFISQQAHSAVNMIPGVKPALAIAGKTIDFAQGAKKLVTQVSQFGPSTASFEPQDSSIDTGSTNAGAVDLLQQSGEYTSPSGSRAAADMLDGPAGLTLEQSCGPGSILKPGSQALVAARIAQGMSQTDALQGLVTGNFGATSVSAVLNSVQTQAMAAASSFNNVAVDLKSAGFLTGQESAGQMGGVVMAASKFGIGQVTGILNSAQGLATGAVGAATGAIGLAGATADKAKDIANSISEGNFAGNLSDTISSGMEGLANSAKAFAGKIGGTLVGLANSLTAPLRSAFNAVEQSYKNLTADTPNVLGKDKTVSSIDLNTAGAKYDSAKAALDLAQSNYDSARFAYRSDPSDENSSILQQAESDWSSAKKAATTASMNFIGDPLSTIGDKISTGFKSLTGSSTSNSQSVIATEAGVNALPGGIESMVSQVNSTGQTAIKSLSSAANQLTQPAKLIGGLVGGTVGSIIGSVGQASAMIAKLQTTLSSLGNASGQIKAAIQASNTFNKTSMISATAQSIDDSRVPHPPSEVSTLDPRLEADSANFDQTQESKANLLKQINAKKEQIDVVISKEKWWILTHLFGNEKTDPDYQQMAAEEGRLRADLTMLEVKYAALIK